MTRTFYAALAAPCGRGRGDARRVARLRRRLGARGARGLGAPPSSCSTSGSSTCSRAGPKVRSTRRCPRGAAAGGSRSPASTGASAPASPCSAGSCSGSSGSPRRPRRSPKASSCSTTRIAFASPTHARAPISGLDPERDQGQMVGNLVRQPEVMRYLEAGDFSEPVIVASQREPGVTLSIQVVPYGDEQKLLLSRDITRIEATARMRREFIANVSHELKTPLTVVSGFVETLQDLDLDARQRQRFLGLVAEQARNMQRLVDDLLTLSALESEQNPPVGRDVPGGAAGRRARRAGAGALGWPAYDRRGRAGGRGRARHRRARRARERVRQPRVERGPLYARRRHDHAVVARRRPKAAGRSPSPTPASASPPSTFPDSPSASIASTAVARARRAGRASASRSSATCCCATRRSSRSRASSAGAARSPSSFPRRACSGSRPRRRKPRRRAHQ